MLSSRVGSMRGLGERLSCGKLPEECRRASRARLLAKCGGARCRGAVECNRRGCKRLIPRRAAIIARCRPLPRCRYDVLPLARSFRLMHLHLVLLYNLLLHPFNMQQAWPRYRATAPLAL